MVDVSVVIPTFRRPALLKEAIQSVLSQARVSVEVIVIDDSPEGSARDTVLALDDARVNYELGTPPSGGRPALVRNHGATRARGRFIHFLDDDDRAAPGFYSAAVAAFDAHARCGVVFGRIEPFADSTPAGAQSEAEAKAMAHEREFFADAGRRARLASRVSARHWMVANLLFNQTLLVNSACMIRRECVAALGGYDAELGMNEDVDFFCRAIRAYGFRFLDRVVLNYRIVPDSLMHGRTNNDKLVQSYRRMYALYRAKHGAAELFALKVLARTVMRAVS